MNNDPTAHAAADHAPVPVFDEWAVVELFGHQKMAGHLTQAPIGDMLRIDVHEADAPDGTPQVRYTRFLNPKAIYAINPCSREIAIAVGRQFAQPPVSRWEMRHLLPPPAEAPIDSDAHEFGEW